eukprot:TRINITY_DN14440_c0_g1_i1.p1 TRINITY_DN14440_c0_g1~~TRINITY_DN14440_c0_g1_i1.p1  ORF type:complete len:397 (+),score=25.39 TRINITY_DN14440_c0_g1_i1:75-1265(+)
MSGGPVIEYRTVHQPPSGAPVSRSTGDRQSRVVRCINGVEVRRQVVHSEEPPGSIQFTNNQRIVVQRVQAPPEREPVKAAAARLARSIAQRKAAASSTQLLAREERVRRARGPTDEAGGGPACPPSTAARHSLPVSNGGQLQNSAAGAASAARAPPPSYEEAIADDGPPRSAGRGLRGRAVMSRDSTMQRDSTMPRDRTMPVLTWPRTAAAAAATMSGPGGEGGYGDGLAGAAEEPGRRSRPQRSGRRAAPEPARPAPHVQPAAASRGLFGDAAACRGLFGDDDWDGDERMTLSERFETLELEPEAEELEDVENEPSASQDPARPYRRVAMQPAREGASHPARGIAHARRSADADDEDEHAHGWQYDRTGAQTARMAAPRLQNQPHATRRMRRSHP